MEKNSQKNDYSSYFDNDEYQENLYYDNLYEKSGANNLSLEKGSNRNKVGYGRKTTIVVLSLFSVAVVVMWVINFRYSLRSPFNYKGEIPLSASTNNSGNCPSGDCSNNNLTADNLELKLIDTDKDGISDWDELFIYGTSPYLEDTDGDGLIDYEEIFIYKTNPNCPEGQDCSGFLNQSSSQNTTSYNDEVDDFYNLLIGLEGSVAGDSQSTNNTQSNQINPTYLRNLLLENGFSQENLDQVSDEDLVSIYQEVLSKDDF